MKLIYAISIILLLSVSSYGQVNISTNIGWTPPVMHVSGKAIDQPLKFKLYVCESPINDDKTCDATISAYDIPEGANQYNLNYKTSTSIGIMYMRLSAISVNGDLEGELSNQLQKSFEDIDPFGPPVINFSITIIQN